MAYALITWAGSRATADTYPHEGAAEEAKEALAKTNADKRATPDTDEWEEIYQGLCEDLYVEEIKE